MLVAPAASAASRRPKRPPAEAPRHFDPAGSTWRGKVDAAEVLQGTISLRIDALGHRGRGLISGRDGGGIVRCALEGVLRRDAVELACRAPGLGAPTLVGTLRGRLRPKGTELRFVGTLRGRPLEGDVAIERAASGR